MVRDAAKGKRLLAPFMEAVAKASSSAHIVNLLCQEAGRLWTGLGWATPHGGQALTRSHRPPKEVNPSCEHQQGVRDPDLSAAPADLPSPPRWPETVHIHHAAIGSTAAATEVGVNVHTTEHFYHSHRAPLSQTRARRLSHTETAEWIQPNCVCQFNRGPLRPTGGRHQGIIAPSRLWTETDDKPGAYSPKCPIQPSLGSAASRKDWVAK